MVDWEEQDPRPLPWETQEESGDGRGIGSCADHCRPEKKKGIPMHTTFKIPFFRES